MRVAFYVSDPWEFGTAHGVGPFVGTVVEVDGERKALVRLETPLVDGERAFVVVQVQSRFAGTSIRDLDGTSADHALSANFVFGTSVVSDLSSAPDHWRPSILGIGSIWKLA